jgi:hypothetical protein
MENSQRNSFIPRSPIKGTVKPRGVRRVYILTYVSYILFFGTLLATSGVFVYSITLDNQLSSEKARLSAERELFNQADLERVKELESRLKTSQNILDRHVSVHSILNALETTTLRPVQIDGFEYVKDSNNSLDLTLTARTQNFNDALFQREIFFSNGILNGAQVSEIKFEESDVSDASATTYEEVQFTLTKKLTVNEIPYTVDSDVESDIEPEPGITEFINE